MAATEGVIFSKQLANILYETFIRKRSYPVAICKHVWVSHSVFTKVEHIVALI